jgi:hypothetical protein
MKPTRVLLLVLLTSSVWQQVVAQPTILDQSNNVWEAVARLQGSGEYAQTFTPTVSGFLNRIEILASRDAYFEGFPVIMTLYNTSGGMPVGQALASESFSAISSDYYTTLSFDLSSSGFAVQQGVSYAFGMSCPNSFYGVSVEASLYDPYPRGSLWVRSPPGSPWILSTGPSDVLFQEYVTVPEPSGLSLLICGVGFLGMLKLRENRGRV